MNGSRVLRAEVFPILASACLFLALGAGFFLLEGHAPVALFLEMVKSAFGDSFAWSETLVKVAPILLCASAVVLPAKLGLVTVGAQGQMNFGAMAGTALVLSMMNGSAWVVLPLMLLTASLGGAFWGAVPGVFKARLGVNETISTLMLNYLALQLVDYVVHGPWKDPGNLGWPASANFPDAAILPTFFGSRVHLGLVIGVVAALILHVLVTYSRWGIALKVMRSNQRVALSAGLNYERNVIIVMAISGLLAGIAGIAETSVMQGRLQAGLAGGYGWSGFLVAWLSGQSFLRIIPMSILVGGLLSSADALQLFAQLPSSSAIILQGMLFVSALVVMNWVKLRGYHA